jgi:hypothetical protein
MELPINEKDLDLIIEAIKTKNKELYGKLWSYKINLKLRKGKE